MAKSDPPRRPRRRPKWEDDLKRVANEAFQGRTPTNDSYGNIVIRRGAADPNPPVQHVQVKQGANWARRAKWGAGAAVGVAAVEVARRHHGKNNWKVKKMDLLSKACSCGTCRSCAVGRGGAGLPDSLKGNPYIGHTREVAVTRRKQSFVQPFTEHYHNSNASPRQLGVTRATGTKGNRTKGTLVRVKGSGKRSPIHRSSSTLVGKGLLAQGLKATGRNVKQFGPVKALKAEKEGFKAAFKTGYNTGNKNLAFVSGANASGKVLKADILPTKARSVQPRTPQGKFVSHANDIQVFHPTFKSKHRQPRTSTLQHYTRGKKDQYAAGFSKSLFGGGAENTLALTGSIDMAGFARNQGRKGVNFSKGMSPMGAFRNASAGQGKVGYDNARNAYNAGAPGSVKIPRIKMPRDTTKGPRVPTRPGPASERPLPKWNI